MERDKNDISCGSSGGHHSLVGLPGRSLPRVAFLLYSSITVRLDLHYFTAYLLLGTEVFTKHLPSYAKGDISGGTTFALPFSFLSTNTLPLEAAQKSPYPAGSITAGQHFPYGKGKTPTHGPSRPASVQHSLLSALWSSFERGFISFIFSLSGIHSTFSSLLK